MLKTDYPDIMSVRKGVLINVSNDIVRYTEEKNKKIDEMQTKTRINTLESKLNNIEQLLQQLLQKAN